MVTLEISCHRSIKPRTPAGSYNQELEQKKGSLFFFIVYASRKLLYLWSTPTRSTLFPGLHKAWYHFSSNKNLKRSLELWLHYTSLVSLHHSYCCFLHESSKCSCGEGPGTSLTLQLSHNKIRCFGCTNIYSTLAKYGKPLQMSEWKSQNKIMCSIR